MQNHGGINLLRLVIMMVVISSSACSNISAVNTPLSSATLTSTHLPTITLVAPTKIYTSVPATPTTPVPTLSAEKRENLITQLLTQDYRCMLPCWGGIEPSITTWPDTKAFLEQFAEIYSNKSAKINYMGKPVYTAFYVSNNIVEFMGVPRFEYPLYRLLQDYGKPDEIYFYILDILPIDANNPYTVYLFYKEKGIIAVYSGASAKGKTISVCFKDAQGQRSHDAFLWLWFKRSDKTFEDIVAQYMNKFSDHLSLKYYKMEELSTHTINDFFEIYELNDNENYCLQINNPNPKP